MPQAHKPFLEAPATHGFGVYLEAPYNPTFQVGPSFAYQGESLFVTMLLGRVSSSPETHS